MLLFLLRVFLGNLVELLGIPYPLLVEQLLEAFARFAGVLDLEILEHARKCCNRHVRVGSAMRVSQWGIGAEGRSRRRHDRRTVLRATVL